jgi:hypothetical protein
MNKIREARIEIMQNSEFGWLNLENNNARFFNEDYEVAVLNVNILYLYNKNYRIILEYRNENLITGELRKKVDNLYELISFLKGEPYILHDEVQQYELLTSSFIENFDKIKIQNK